MSRANGAHCEQLALRHLQKYGLTLLAKNFRCRHGEVDLVMRDAACLVFVEVRYRSANRFSSAAHSVDSRKQGKIARTASMFLAKHPQYGDCPVRFDVVAFDGADTAQGRIQWIRDAFRV